MFHIKEEIYNVLRAWNIDDVECIENVEPENDASIEPLENLIKITEKLLENPQYMTGCVEYANLNKMLALCYLQMGNELEAICKLIESHAVLLRQHISHRSMKTEMRETMLQTQQNYGLKSLHIKFNAAKERYADILKSRLAELPQEWYTIHITVPYESRDVSKCIMSTTKSMHPVHITVLHTGQNKLVEPLCITVPKPKTHTSYDVCNEIHNLMSSNKSQLVARYSSNELYWKMRGKQDARMKTAIKELEFSWLREWRILFLADPIDKQEIVNNILEVIDKLISDYTTIQSISKRSEWLLKKIALGACFLNREEIARAVNYVLSDHPKLASNIILSIYGKLGEVEKLKTATRKTLILIVDEDMDFIPFESMEILKSHPVTRFPSLHIAYALFKEHKDTMENGCKVIRAKPDMGTCIVNPSGNLANMEKRIKIFIDYWLPHWESYYSVQPTEEIFENALVNRDILMYNGHGNGIQYFSGEDIQRLRVKSVILLFGCSSVKLLPIGGRYPPFGVSNQYLLASSPCVLGMLWEVTDADTDKMTARFISDWIPSTAHRPWSDVDIGKWCGGTLKFVKNQRESAQNVPTEPEMLRAVAKSKEICTQYMTAAATVARGLPIRLVM